MKDSIRRFLNISFAIPKFDNFAEKTGPFMCAQSVVRFYYIAMLFLSLSLFSSWWDTSFIAQSTITQFWPTFWLPLVGATFAVYFVRLLFLFGSALATMFPGNRFARALAFVGLLEFVSLYVSFWKLDVDFYAWVATAFILIFLPKWKNPEQSDTDNRKKFLLVVWACQTIVMVGYSMGAFGKILHSVPAFLAGHAHSFSINAASLHIADRLLTTNSVSVLGPFVINNPLIGWPIFVGVIFLMLFAIITSFRLPLQRLWGIGLIMYHIAAYLTMNIGFIFNVLLISILFLDSPFKDRNMKLKEILSHLPLFGKIFSINKSERKITS